ncbi:zinc finger protein 252-like [Mugil cephalus]|uniref:zinc finger protein 252-like n=1 Tax=Mugil cephalus TaxID=48193 RepID=UPI001FB85F22|nr:zinc finger protein 252-like [Mugil cephalus]
MCSVVGCDSFRRGVHRFKLPEDPERRLVWVQFLFEVNGQRLKESSWTDITICCEHFTDDSFESLTPGTDGVQLKPDAVPSLCVKSEPEDPVESPQNVVEPFRSTEVALQCDDIKTCDSPTSYTENSPTSVADSESPSQSHSSNSSTSDYGEMIQQIENIDTIRKKAALLQMKGKYVVNEKWLIQLFSCRCPLCGSKVNVEKVIYGMLLVLKKQCLKCDYKNLWKSQVNARIPKGGGAAASSERTVPSTGDDQNSNTDVSETDATSDEESTDETEESGELELDNDWNPASDGSTHNELCSESDEDSAYENGDYLSFFPQHSELCTDCGKFYNKRKGHTCEHKIRPFSCNICGKRCVSEVALNSHSRVHDENYEHRCKYCHATFKTKGDKVSHEEVHQTEGMPYKCPDCSETFATNKERRIHLEDHRGPKQLKCHICGMEFNRSTPLQRHLVVHTGERPHKCSVCQRGFNQPSHLKSHMRLHTGERPFKCQHCDKSFNHNVSLKSHVQRYHTLGSGEEQKTGKLNKSKVANGGAQGNGKKRGGDSGLRGEQGQRFKKRRIYLPKKKKRSTGRPIGRPKRNVQAEKIQGQGSGANAGKVKMPKLKRTRCRDQEKEGEPIESDIYFDSAEEELQEMEELEELEEGEGEEREGD